jgi:hypothetical protein
MTERTTGQPLRRELAHRSTDGVDIRLFWSKPDNRLTVEVTDAKRGERFQLDAPAEGALDVFYHPYAYAAIHGTAIPDDRPKSAPHPSTMTRCAWGF